MTSLFDTSVLFSVLNNNEKHHAWSVAQLTACKVQGPVVVSDIVYCEFSAGMATRSDVDTVLRQLDLDRLPRDDDALFRAGKAFVDYRRKHHGPKERVLADFLIGAAAEMSGSRLVTTNANDFLTYFPTLHIIRP